jgi:hypothetical protein
MTAPGDGRETVRAVSGRRGSARREWAAVAVVYAAVVIVAAIWLAIDRHPPEWDYANHLEHAIHCRRDLASGDIWGAFAHSSFYPPLVPCLGGLAYALLPSDVVFGELVMLGFLGIGMAATYAVARRFAGGVGSVVAATLFATAPIVVNLGLRFQLDVPLAAMVIALLAVLLATDRFTRPGWALAAGIVFGLGMLTKPPFFVYVAPACVLVLAGTRGRRAWLQACVAGLLAVLVALPWYGTRVFGLSAQIQNRSFKQADEAGFPAALSPASLAYYPLNFPVHFGIIAVLLLLVGLGVAMRRRCWFVLAGLAPFLVFLMLQNKQMRYAVPLLPMAAVAGGVGFGALPRPGRFVAGVAVAFAAAVQISTTAFAVPAVVRLPVIGVLPTDPAPPSRADWQQRQILALVARDSGGASHTVSVMPNHPHFSAANFRYYAAREDLPIRVGRAWEGEPVGIEYMILKTGDLGPPWTIEKARRVGERLAADAWLARVFPVIGEFALPDGSMATVRARRVPADLEVTADALARAVTEALRVRLGEVMRDVEGLDIRLDYDAAILSGRVRRLEISAAEATVGELRRRNAALLRLQNVRFVVDDALINPWSAAREGRFDPLDAARFTIDRATIATADLQRFIGRVKGLGRMSLTPGAGFVDLAFELPGPDVGARVQLLSTGDRPLTLVAERVTVGGLTVPSVLVNWIMTSYDPSRGIASRLPFPATIRPVTVTPGFIRIGEERDVRQR